MVAGGFGATIAPLRSDRAASSAASGSAPITRSSGRRPWAAMAVPDSRPPPPTGAIDDVEIGHLVDELERGGARARDHVVVIERMDLDRAGFGDHGGHARLARRERRLAQHHTRAVRRDRLALAARRGARHDDVRGDAARPRRERERGPVVPRRVRRDSTSRAARATATAPRSSRRGT